jgi:hypothetical protein
MMSRNEETPIAYAVSDSIPINTIQRNSRIMATAANIVLTLPAPQRRLAQFPFSVQNTTSGWVSVAHADFIGDLTGVAIEPYGRADFTIVRSSGAYYWSAVGGRAMVRTNTWTPTMTWGTADPADYAANAIAEYWLGHGGVYFSVSTTTTDGNGASSLTISLPVIPAEYEIRVPVTAWATVDGTVTDIYGYIDAANNTEASRTVNFFNWATWTNAKTCSIQVTGWYPISDALSTFTATETWATGTPGSITEVALYNVIDTNVIYFLTDWTSSDSTGATGLTCLLPSTAQTPDRDGYVAGIGLESCKTSAEYNHTLPTIDCANATAASRIITCNAFTTATDNEAIRVSLFGLYELAGWTSFDPDPTWGTADPGTITEKAFYYVDSLGICHFWVYLTSADGNGASSLVLKPPVAPKQNSAGYALMAVELQNATYSNPCAFLDTVEADAQDRTIQFSKWSTATNAQTVTVYVSGSYPVG